MLYLSLSVLLLWSPLQPNDESLLGGTFENRRLHLRVRPPAGWKIVSAGATEDEPIEFWKEDENGPRIQITSYPYPISDGSDIDKVQAELSKALKRKFPSLRVDQETKLIHQGNPAIEVMATLPAADTYYHVIQRCLFARGRLSHHYLCLVRIIVSFRPQHLSSLPGQPRGPRRNLRARSGRRRPPLHRSHRRVRGLRTHGVRGFSPPLLGCPTRPHRTLTESC